MFATPFLNYDTIREILSACASLMRPCRFFYHEAGRFIAQDGVILRKPRKIASFTLFISGEDRSRCLCIRKLRIDHSYNENALRQLSLCLHHLTSLASLTVSGDEQFKISPPFATAVAQLTSLLHLESSGVGHISMISCFILQTVQSKQLRLIKLGWLTEHEGLDSHETQKIEYHPVALLSQWTSSLESVACSAWFTSLDLPVFPHVYPKMHKLSIDWDDFPLVAPYIRAYPNLKWIDFHTADIVDWEYEEDRIRAHHELNVRNQSTGAGSRWQELEGVDGRVIDFYLLGLVCPISCVSFCDVVQSERDLDVLPEILAYARPKELKIEGDCKHILYADNGLLDMLQTSAGSRLENLLLLIKLSVSDREVDIAAALGRLGAALRRCPLRRLRLCVRGTGILNPIPHPLCLVEELPLTLAERSLQAFDLPAYSRIRNDDSERRLSYIPPRTGVDIPQQEWPMDWEL